MTASVTMFFILLAVLALFVVVVRSRSNISLPQMHHQTDTETSDEIGIAMPPDARPDFGGFPEFFEDSVTLLARDPHTLFAYWEVTYEAIDRHSRQTGDRIPPAIILRIIDANQRLEQKIQHDIWVNSRLGNYYFHLLTKSDAFYAEIGLMGKNGFWTVARSETVMLPKAFGATSDREYEGLTSISSSR